MSGTYITTTRHPQHYGTIKDMSLHTTPRRWQDGCCCVSTEGCVPHAHFLLSHGVCIYLAKEHKHPYNFTLLNTALQRPLKGCSCTLRSIFHSIFLHQLDWWDPWVLGDLEWRH
jgi:hypothetical protein